MAAPAAGGHGGDVLVSTALSNFKRQAETVRASLGQLDVVTAPPGEVMSRFQAAANQMDGLRLALSGSSLRYQAVRPIAVPAVPEHIPEFLRTKKDPAAIEADAVAERVGAAAPTTTSEYNLDVSSLARHYDRLAVAAISSFKGSHAAALRDLEK